MEEARRISREVEKGDYDSDRGCRWFKLGRGSQKSVHESVRIFTYYLFTLHYSLKMRLCTDFWEVISNSEKGRSEVQTRCGKFV